MFSHVTGSEEAPRAETFIEALRSAEASVAEVERKIERLAERLCGPCDVGGAESSGYSHPGILLEASDGAYTIMYRVRNIEAAIARIADLLPPEDRGHMPTNTPLTGRSQR